jgi:hypothetical protein
MTARTPWSPPVPPPWGDALNEGFEIHFLAPLKEWFSAYVPEQELTTVGLRSHLVWTRHRNRDLDAGDFMNAAFRAGDTVILVALDAALYEVGERSRYVIRGAKPGSADVLNKMLGTGGSAWRVRDDGLALERRVPEAVRDAAAGAISTARTASVDAADHLTKAWRHAYGIAPEATPAYGEAIRAVESAAGRLVQPNNAKATLGTINGAIRAAPGSWRMAITDALGGPRDGTPVLNMMELLWTGQTDRHGANPTIPVTLEAAQAAVHLAAALVQLWTSGGVTKV